MASYVSKMKRKDLDEVNGDFTDLLFSAPATKIRRLDAELPLMVEKNQEPFTKLPDEEMCSAVLDGRSGFTEAILPPSLNEERALVMYKPPDTHFAPSLKINPKLVTSLKNYTFWPRNPNMLVEEECGEERQSPTNKCLAVVPWFPSHATVTRQLMDALTTTGNELLEEAMEAEEEEAPTFMEIEEDNGESVITTGVGAQNTQQWQQHCMTPQPLQSNSTIMWS